MIQIILGKKGAGKTKRLLEMANRAATEAKGSVVFVDDDDSCMFDLNLSIRFVNTAEFDLKGPKMFFGFLNGIAASDHDLEYLFLDGFLRLVGHELVYLEEFFQSLEAFSRKHDVRLVLSVSCAEEELPNYLRPYVL